MVVRPGDKTGGGFVGAKNLSPVVQGAGRLPGKGETQGMPSQASAPIIQGPF